MTHGLAIVATRFNGKQMLDGLLKADKMPYASIDDNIFAIADLIKYNRSNIIISNHNNNSNNVVY